MSGSDLLIVKRNLPVLHWNIFRLCLCVVIAATVSILLSGCVTKPEIAPPPTEKESVGSPDLLKPGDAVVINFTGISDPPPGQQDRIREDGIITLPYIGSVQAAGKTRAELQQEITDLYVPRFYRRLDVTVNPDVRYIYISGEVKIPSRHAYMGGMTVLKAITTAGGFTDFANIKKVQLLRANQTKPIEVNCKEARENSGLDLPVYPDDTIHVPRRII